MEHPASSSSSAEPEEGSSLTAQRSLAGDSADKVKIRLHLRAVAQAPALKQNKFTIDSSQPFGEIERYLRKKLKRKEAMFCYCGNGFIPIPDQILQDLFDCFGQHGELVVYYGYQEAWG